MTAELPTADRDLRLIAEAIRSQADISTRLGQFSELVTRAKQIREIADALPVLLDRARQQGRAEVIEAITKSPPSLEELLAGTEFAAALARGSQTAPSATENAETGGGA